MWNDAGLSEILTLNNPDSIEPWGDYPYMVSGNGWKKYDQSLDPLVHPVDNTPYEATKTIFANKDKLSVAGAAIRNLRVLSGLGYAAANFLGYDLGFDSISHEFKGQESDISSIWQASRGGKTGLTIVNFGLHKEGSGPLTTAIDHKKTLVIFKETVLDDTKLKNMMFEGGTPFPEEPVQVYGINDTTFVVKAAYNEDISPKLDVYNKENNAPTPIKKYKLNVFKIDPDEGIKRIESVNSDKHQLDFVVGIQKVPNGVDYQKIEYTGENLYFMDEQGQTMVATPEGFKKLFDWNPVLRKDARTVNPLKLIVSVRDNRTFVIPVDNGERGISFQVIDYLQDLGDENKGNFYFKQNLPTVGVGNFKLQPNINSFPINEPNQVQSGAYVLASGTQDGGLVHVVYKFDNSGNAIEWDFESDKNNIFSKKTIVTIGKDGTIPFLAHKDTNMTTPDNMDSIVLSFKPIESQITKTPSISQNSTNGISSGSTEPRYSTQPVPAP